MSDPTKCYSLNEHFSSRLVLVQMKLANFTLAHRPQASSASEGPVNIGTDMSSGMVYNV